MFCDFRYGTAVFLQLISWLGETHVKLRLLGVLAVVMLQLLGATSACAQCGEPSELPEAAIASMEAVSVPILLEEEVVTQRLIATEPQPVAFELNEPYEITCQVQRRAAIDIDRCERYWVREAILVPVPSDLLDPANTIAGSTPSTVQESVLGAQQVLVGLAAEPSVMPSVRYLPPVSEATDTIFVSVESDVLAKDAKTASHQEIQRRYEETERWFRKNNKAYQEILAAGRRWDEFDRKYGKKTTETANNKDNINNTQMPLTPSQPPYMNDRAPGIPPAHPPAGVETASSIRYNVPYWYRMTLIAAVCAFVAYMLLAPVIAARRRRRPT